jgi:hypothetical protein
MTIANDIVVLLESKRRLGPVTAEEISQLLFGQVKGYPQRVNQDLRELVKKGRLERLGGGGSSDPYKYRIKPLRIRRISAT